MKYIRTKDKVYITNCDTFDQFGKKWYWVGGEEKAVCVESVIKTTDTIEELCDEFVFEDTDKYKRIIENFGIAKTLNSGNLYGAIWTEWGLKYVAKMNDGGELELICK